MGHQSIVTGYVVLHPRATLENTLRAIAQFPFDEVYPFTNIFWHGSPAQYGGVRTLGLAGSYKQIEQDWSEWLWRFAELLSRLDATRARANLDCLLGHYSWRLEPQALCDGGPWPESFVGQPWFITEAPDDDFSLTVEAIYGDPPSTWQKHLPRRLRRERATPA